MPKALTFKGDPKPKKRKRPAAAPEEAARSPSPTAEDESWVLASSASDITGPVILVFAPTDGAVQALASDPAGTPFLSALENVVDERPESAEPHDVRQVWVATRVAGTATLGLKGGAGYLSSAGGLSARAEAQGPREGWEFVSTDREGWFEVRNGGAGIAVEGKGLTTVADARPVCVRMQARFKPRLAAEKRERAGAKVGRAQIEREAGRKLDDGQIARLKRARKEGTYYEEMLDVRAKGKHDKFA